MIRKVVVVSSPLALNICGLSLAHVSNLRNLNGKTLEVG